MMAANRPRADLNPARLAALPDMAHRVSASPLGPSRGNCAALCFTLSLCGIVHLLYPGEAVQLAENPGGVRPLDAGFVFENWCRGPELNRGHADFQSAALPG